MQEVSVYREEDGLKFVLSGEIDSGNSEDFYAEVMQAYGAQPADVRFSCERLSFIDSTTLGTFVRILKRVREDGHKIVLSGLQPRIKKLFVICALDTVMEIEG